jgi:hypothetical protein
MYGRASKSFVKDICDVINKIAQTAVLGGGDAASSKR